MDRPLSCAEHDRTAMFFCVALPLSHAAPSYQRQKRMSPCLSLRAANRRWGSSRCPPPLFFLTAGAESLCHFRARYFFFFPGRPNSSPIVFAPAAGRNPDDGTAFFFFAFSRKRKALRPRRALRVAMPETGPQRRPFFLPLNVSAVAEEARLGTRLKPARFIA